MINLKKIFFLCLAFILLNACNDEIYDTNGLKTDLFRITSLDTIVSSRTAAFELDVDGDEISDFSFIGDEGHSQGGYNWYSSKLQIQNQGIKIPLVNLLDSSMLCYYYTFVENDTVISHIYYNTLSETRCNYVVSKEVLRIDTILSIQGYQTLDSILLADYISNADNRAITLSSSFTDRKILMFINGLTFNGYSEGRWIREFLNNQTFYIYFTIPKRSKFKFGWIKMKIKGYHQMQLLEYAVEK